MSPVFFGSNICRRIFLSDILLNYRYCPSFTHMWQNGADHNLVVRADCYVKQYGAPGRVTGTIEGLTKIKSIIELPCSHDT